MRVDPYAQNYNNLKECYEKYLIRYLKKHFQDQVDHEAIVVVALEDVAEIMTKDPEKIERPKSYLTTTVRNAARTEVKKPKEEVLPPDPPIPGGNEYIEDTAERLGLPKNAPVADICFAMVELHDEPCKTILTLYLEGKKLNFIAEVVGMKYDSVKSKKSQCINSLKTLISKL